MSLYKRIIGGTKLKNKIFLIILLLLVIASIIIFLVLKNISMNDISQKTVVVSEIEKINNYGIVDSEIKSTGKYAEVERALKDYILETQKFTTDISNEYKNEKIVTILSADNYKKDGPDFVESKQLLASVQSKGEETKAKLLEMNTEEYKEKRANDLRLNRKV